MTAATIYRDFNRSAIASNLSGRQMQLWLKLYEFLHSYRRQDVQLYTPMLLDMLNISLSQFRRARQGLIEAGFLSIRQDSQQHTSYTLLLNGRAISFVPEKSCFSPVRQLTSVDFPAPLRPTRTVMEPLSAVKEISCRIGRPR